MKNILVTTPSLSLKGGVVEYNKMLLKYSSSKIDVFEFKSASKKSNLLKVLYLVLDYVFFTKKIIFNYKIVHIGPSLSKTALLRDSLYVFGKNEGLLGEGNKLLE